MVTVYSVSLIIYKRITLSNCIISRSRKTKLLEEFPKHDLEIFYLVIENQKMVLHTTSSVNNTLQLGSGVKVIYEK